MPTLLLVRHGRTDANAGGVLAGRTPGVHLDDTGAEQAQRLADRALTLPLVRVVASPLERTVETAQAVLASGGTRSVPRPELLLEPGLIECDYGSWTGRAIKDLAKEPEWKVVQTHPSAAKFPGGEGLAAVSARSVAAVREHDRAVAQNHGPHALWMAVAHGDVIKSILADALGMHLDGFQRLMVNPCSVSVIRYTPTRPFVERINDVGADLSGLAPPRRRSRRAPSADAVVGGDAG